MVKKIFSYAQTFENSVATWSKHHQHVDSYVFMARVGYMDRFVGFLENHFQNWVKEKGVELAGKWGFQMALRDLHIQDYPQVKIDTLAKVFSRVDPFLMDP